MTLTQPHYLVHGMNRKLIITVSVVVFHMALLWALQAGLLRRAIDIVVPAEILLEPVAPPMPKVAPPAPVPPAPLKPAIAKTAQAPVKLVSPQPLAIADPTPAANAPVGVIAPPAPVAPPAAAPTAPVALAPVAPVRIELPSSDADYLHNPKPPYPRISSQLNEQGKVVVRVFIGADGTAQKAEIRQSSGFDRLDQSALATALRWRYVPGKRAGVPEAMWFNVPINFVLE